MPAPGAASRCCGSGAGHSARWRPACGRTPTSARLGKLFTVAYVLIGIGVLVAFGTAFAKRLLELSKAEHPDR